jgi:CRISPR-associated protein Csm4
MAYPTYRFTLRPRTAFGTPLVGDTLFGQLCWALRHRLGHDWLGERLAAYTKGGPFLVLSDAFPWGFLPLPTVPASLWKEAAGDVDRKALKKKRWLPLEKTDSPFAAWQSLACNDTEAANAVFRKRGVKVDKASLQITHTQPHNSINRATATTDQKFTPYAQSQYWFHPEMRLDIYAVLDEALVTPEEFTDALTDVGKNGYGGDASAGLGKFTVERDTTFGGLPHAASANAFLTLAPCAPQGQGFDPERSHYQPLTRFGRHGDAAVHTANPFKHPVLLAKTGSVFTPKNGVDSECRFIGQGVSGVSSVMPETVTQGYAPVIGIRMMENAR